jgi:putative endonuclease
MLRARGLSVLMRTVLRPARLPPLSAAPQEREARRGAEAERRARRFYRLRGYRVLGTNVWAGGNEIDLIVRRGRNLVFCEVKEKSLEGFGDPAEMVGPEKQRRLRRAAEAWLAERPELGSLEVRFDVVVERGGHLERLAHAF